MPVGASVLAPVIEEPHFVVASLDLRLRHWSRNAASSVRHAPDQGGLAEFPIIASPHRGPCAS
jgi:hypothetical protein